MFTLAFYDWGQNFNLNNREFFREAVLEEVIKETRHRTVDYLIMHFWGLILVMASEVAGIRYRDGEYYFPKLSQREKTLRFKSINLSLENAPPERYHSANLKKDFRDFIHHFLTAYNSDSGSAGFLLSFRKDLTEKQQSLAQHAIWGCGFRKSVDEDIARLKKKLDAELKDYKNKLDAGFRSWKKRMKIRDDS